MKHEAIATHTSRGAPQASSPQQVRQPGRFRRFLPEIVLIAIMVLLAFGLRAVALFH